MACGAIPLLAGGSVFLLWLATRWNWLMWAGIFTIYGGVATFFTGMIALGRYWWNALHSSDVTRRRLWVSTIGCAVLLISNFPVAAAMVVAAVAIMTRYTIVVHNASQRPLVGVHVFGGGCDADFGTIAPDKTVRRAFWIRHDGDLQFCAKCGATVYTETIDSYVTNGSGGHTTVTIHPNSTISFDNTRD